MPLYFTNWETNEKIAEYVGAVIAEREANYYDDSDFYALVWDEATGSPKEIQYGTTRAACNSGCVVDATPEICEKFLAWQEHKRGIAKAEREDFFRAYIKEGSRIRVIGGRKCKGVEATVLKVFPCNFKSDRWRTSFKANIQTTEGVYHNYIPLEQMEVFDYFKDEWRKPENAYKSTGYDSGGYTLEGIIGMVPYTWANSWVDRLKAKVG